MTTTVGIEPKSTPVLDAQLFAKAAGLDVAIWTATKGFEITHTNGSKGMITKVGRSDNGQSVTFYVHLNGRERKFDSVRSIDRFRYLHISNLQAITPQLRDQVLSLEEYLEQEQAQAEKQQEQEARRRLAEEQREREQAEERELQKAAWILEQEERRKLQDKRRHQLSQVAQRVHKGERIAAWELDLLESENERAVLATYYENEFRRTGNGGIASTACSNWRKASRPKEAVRLTEEILSPRNNYLRLPPRTEAALLTCRGAALLDLGELATVVDLAERAYAVHADAYSLNLLGKYYFVIGEYSRGEEYFRQANPNTQSQEREIGEAMKKLTPLQRRRAAEYLLETDEVKYAWADRYLGTLQVPKKPLEI